MKRGVLLAMFVCLISTAQFVQAQSLRILTNHLGYEPSGPKRAVVQGKEGDGVTTFTVREYTTDKEVFSGAALKTGPVRKWKDWHFWTVEFDGVTAEGITLSNAPLAKARSGRSHLWCARTCSNGTRCR